MLNDSKPVVLSGMFDNVIGELKLSDGINDVLINGREFILSVSMIMEGNYGKKIICYNLCHVVAEEKNK